MAVGSGRARLFWPDPARGPRSLTQSAGQVGSGSGQGQLTNTMRLKIRLKLRWQEAIRRSHISAFIQSPRAPSPKWYPWGLSNWRRWFQLDPDNFALTNTTTGTQIGKNQELLDLSNQACVNAFFKDMQAWMMKQKSNKFYYLTKAVFLFFICSSSKFLINFQYFVEKK